MKTLEKLSRKDKTNLVTKKDGTLKKRVVEAISFCKWNQDNKFYTDFYSGSGRFSSIGTYHNEIMGLLILLGYKHTTGNDAPKSGAQGNYIQVSKIAFNTIISLIK